jgi:hypothetical protein
LARINLILKDDLDGEFRRAVFGKYGLKKGNIQKATEEAIEQWIKQQHEKQQQGA